MASSVQFFGFRILPVRERAPFTSFFPQPAGLTLAPSLPEVYPQDTRRPKLRPSGCRVRLLQTEGLVDEQTEVDLRAGWRAAPDRGLLDPRPLERQHGRERQRRQPERRAGGEH